MATNRKIGAAITLVCVIAAAIGVVVGFLSITTAVGIAVVGILIGTGSAIALTRLVRSLMYGVSPYDPLTLTFVAVLLLVTSVLAALIPAYRASRTDPMASLRCE